MGKEHELVMGIPTCQLFDDAGFYFSGFHPPGPLAQHLMQRINKHAGFRYRGHCETDPSWKQIIPYCIISNGEEVFVYQRKVGSEEERLHAKASIGVGGHISPATENPLLIRHVVNTSMLRELKEEVIFEGWPAQIPKPTIFAGMINWDQDEVGQVHFGLVYHMLLSGPATIKVRETDKLKGRMHSLSQLKNDYANWEPWSELVIDHYLPTLIRSRDYVTEDCCY